MSDAADQPTFEQKVTAALSNLTQNEAGKDVFPEDTPEEVKYAAMLEKRRRDTQSAYSKIEDALNAKTIETEKLAEELAKNVILSNEQQSELETLKQTDPEAWRAKLNELEQGHITDLKTKRDEIAQTANKETELEKRTRLLSEFNTANKLELTDQLIADEIPPKYTKQLENGEITFEQYLDTCATLLGKEKAIETSDAKPDGKTLTDIGGSSTPKDSAVSEDINVSYKVETY